MKILIEIAKSWNKSLKGSSRLRFLLIFFILILLLLLPIVGSFLPFTYLAL